MGDILELQVWDDDGRFNADDPMGGALLQVPDGEVDFDNTIALSGRGSNDTSMIHLRVHVVPDIVPEKEKIKETPVSDESLPVQVVKANGNRTANITIIKASGLVEC